MRWEWDGRRDWGGRSSLLIMNVEIFDLGGRDNQCVTIVLALDPHMPQGDVVAGDNLFDFPSQSDTVL